MELAPGLHRRRFLAVSMAAAAALAEWEAVPALGMARGQPAPADASATDAVQGTREAPRRLKHAAFLDLQVNGFAGVDFNDPSTTVDQVHEALAAMRRTGVTRLLPTLISAPLDRFEKCARTVLDAHAPAVVGFHLEGPYISPQEGARGAHRPEDIFPASLDDFRRRHELVDGRVKLVTLAPEVPGAMDLIEYLHRHNIRVAIGHTSASPEQIKDAIRAGATLSTHLGNGCPQMLPRHPNVIWEQLAADELTASLIVDGHHLPPSTVKAMVRAKSPDRVVLVTDATAAAGQPPGDYKLGALTVHVDATGRVAVPGQANLAGSALSMDRAVGNIVRFTGITLEDALAMASTRPASYLGLPELGTLTLDWDPVRSILDVAGVDD